MYDGTPEPRFDRSVPTETSTTSDGRDERVMNRVAPALAATADRGRCANKRTEALLVHLLDLYEGSAYAHTRTIRGPPRMFSAVAASAARGS